MPEKPFDVTEILKGSLTSRAKNKRQWDSLRELIRNAPDDDSEVVGLRDHFHANGDEELHVFIAFTD